MSYNDCGDQGLTPQCRPKRAGLKVKRDEIERDRQHFDIDHMNSNLRWCGRTLKGSSRISTFSQEQQKPILPSKTLKKCLLQGISMPVSVVIRESPHEASPKVMRYSQQKPDRVSNLSCHKTQTIEIIQNKIMCNRQHSPAHSHICAQATVPRPNSHLGSEQSLSLDQLRLFPFPASGGAAIL